MSVIYRNWLVHHVIRHPLMAVFELVLGMPKVGAWFHDMTLPLGEYHNEILEE